MFFLKKNYMNYLSMERFSVPTPQISQGALEKLHQHTVDSMLLLVGVMIEKQNEPVSCQTLHGFISL